LHHFSDKPAFMTEARRVLKQEGKLMSVSLDPHTDCEQWWVYDYFPQTVDLDKERYLSGHAIRQMMLASGFKGCRTFEAQHRVLNTPARTALEHGRLAKTVTSQLVLLSDDEYMQGISRIWRDIEAAEDHDEVLTLSVDVRLYATIGLVA
jgi:hypothetical protein